MRSVLEWSVRHHLITAFSASILLLESMMICSKGFGLMPVFFVFSLVFGAYNAYRLLFQRINLRSVPFNQWPIRLRVRFFLVLFSFVLAIWVAIMNRVNLTIPVFLVVLFVIYSSNRLIGVPDLWKDFFGLIKAPLLALVWFCATTYLVDHDDACNSVDFYVRGMNRYGILLLVAMSNDMHDREKDAERGLKTWAVRCSNLQFINLGLIFALCMISVSFFHVGKPDWMLLAEVGILNGVLGFVCLLLSIKNQKHYKHVLLMDCMLVIGSLAVLFANYLRNLPI